MLSPVDSRHSFFEEFISASLSSHFEDKNKSFLNVEFNLTVHCFNAFRVKIAGANTS